MFVSKIQTFQKTVPKLCCYTFVNHICHSVVTNHVTTIPLPKKSKHAPIPIVQTRGVLAATEAPIRDVSKEQVIMPNFSFAPIYRVVLRYNNWDDDKETAKMVKQCVPVISYSAAKQIVANARSYGMSIVVTAMMDEAKKYCDCLLMRGLDADMIEA